jgi:hypothetical protein
MSRGLEMVRSVGLIALFAAILSGCASAPSASDSAAANASATPVVAQASSAPATASPVATPAPVPGAAVAEKPELVAEAEKVPAGYRAIERDGQVMYCQTVTPLGTRFPKQVCMTQAEYRDSVYRRDQLRQELTGKQKSYSINH